MKKTGKKSRVRPSEFDGVMAVRSAKTENHNEMSGTSGDQWGDTLKQPLCDLSMYCGKRWEGFNQENQSKFYKDINECSDCLSCCLPNRNNRKHDESTENPIDDLRYDVAGKSQLHQLFQRSENSDQNAELDLQQADELIHSVENVNIRDPYGETVLHKAARMWHVDVALFLVKHKADVNAANESGCTPLHVAAAMNYTEMMSLLIKYGANKEAITTGDKQTPLFFAARYNCSDALDRLIDEGCLFDAIQDYKGRYPIQLAAEQDRSITTRLLLRRGARAWMNRDNVPGCGTIDWMIINMPAVAFDALDLFHTTDRTSRRQNFYLYQLMADDNKESFIELPLQVAVNKHHYNLLSHRVFSTLINYMWDQNARLRAIRWFLFNIFYVLVWSLIGVLVPYDQKHYYNLPDQSWRIVLEVIGIGITLWEMVEEVREYRHSIKKSDEWKEFRKDELQADMKYCISGSDRQFLSDELHELDKHIPRYFKDFWNVFDWVCYACLGVCIVSHIVDVIKHSEEAARFHINFMALTLVLLWLRLAKCARPFKQLGPLIVILGEMFEDVILFACLYLQFYLPFVCAYWMVFGGEKVTYDTRYRDNNTAEYVTVDGYESVGGVFFSLFRITLVDDFDYDTMKSVDPIMADILVGTWLAVSAIVCLNLFIALLSDSFQRVYENAHSIARMQKAIVCLVYWDLLNNKSRKQFLEDMKKYCNPLQQAYDDDDGVEETDGNEMQKAVVQLRDITRIQRQNQDNLVAKLDSDLTKIDKEIATIKELIFTLQSSQRPPEHPGYGGTDDLPTAMRSSSKKKKKKRKTSSKEKDDDSIASGETSQTLQSIPTTSQMKITEISSINMDDDEN